MHLKDLREYIQALDNIGEVQSVEKSVDLFLEAGGIIRRSYDLRAPAPLFFLRSLKITGPKTFKNAF